MQICLRQLILFSQNCNSEKWFGAASCPSACRSINDFLLHFWALVSYYLNLSCGAVAVETTGLTGQLSLDKERCCIDCHFASPSNSRLSGKLDFVVRWSHHRYYGLILAYSSALWRSPYLVFHESHALNSGLFAVSLYFPLSRPTSLPR